MLIQHLPSKTDAFLEETEIRNKREILLPSVSSQRVVFNIFTSKRATGRSKRQTVYVCKKFKSLENTHRFIMWCDVILAPSRSKKSLSSSRERGAKQAAWYWRETHMFTWQSSQWAAVQAGSKSTDDAEWPISREAGRTHARTRPPPSQQSVPAHEACTWGGRERKGSTWRQRARYLFQLLPPVCSLE